jgi:putative membrane protein
MGGASVSRNILAGLALAATLAAGCAASAAAQDPAKLNDLEIAHAAYVAGDIDIRNAHLALALSDDPRVREFAELMISDHEAVNQAALELLKKLKAEPQDNAFSQALIKGAHDNWAKMAKLSGKEFDKSYAANELSYHQTVNHVVGDAFIPNVENAELKTLLGSALDTFKAHEKHAEQMVAEIGS